MIDVKKSGRSVLDTISWIMNNCNNDYSCDKCPINVKDNDRDCAYYIAGMVLDADWNGFAKLPEGVVPIEYLKED